MAQITQENHMFSQLPTPSPDDLRSFQHCPEAIRAATAIKADLLRAIQQAHPFTIAAVARQFFPAEGDFQSVSKLGLEIAATMRELAAHGEDCQTVDAAEKDRLSATMSAAIRRHLDIAGRMPQLAEQLRRHETDTSQRRQKLVAAGVSGADLERLSTDETLANLLAEQKALQVENEALERFLATSEESHLPAGFAIPEAVKVSVPLPKTEVPAFFRAA
jgi:hypothetical protein